MGWLTARSFRQEERVDRIYAQQRVFTINSVALEEVWTGLGDGATPHAAAAGEGDKWLEEVTKALGLEWPLHAQSLQKSLIKEIP